MSLTITWQVEQLRTLDHLGTGFVAHVVYLATAKDGVAEAWHRGQIEFEAPGDSFTPFQDLTEAQVTQWVLDHLGQEEVQRLSGLLAIQIDKQLNPPVAPKAVSLPWAPE
jgi:hypothetical protein